MYVQRELCEGCDKRYFIDELNCGFCSKCQLEREKQTPLDTDKENKGEIKCL